MSRGSGERFFRRYRGSCISLFKPTAFSRGYILSPLRGFGKTLSKKQEGTTLLHKSEHKKPSSLHLSFSDPHKQVFEAGAAGAEFEDGKSCADQPMEQRGLGVVAAVK